MTTFNTHQANHAFHGGQLAFRVLGSGVKTGDLGPCWPHGMGQLHLAWGGGGSPRLGEAGVVCDPAISVQALFQVLSKYRPFVMTATK